MPPRPDTRPPSGKFLTATFVAVAVSFVLVALYTHVTAHQIDVASDSIALASAPSVEHLAALRVDVHQVEHRVAAYLGLLGEAASSRADVDRALADLDHDVHAYLAVPFFPGEKALWDQVQQSLVDVTGAAHDVLSLSDAGRADAAERVYNARLRPAVDRGSDAAMRDIELNARMGRYAAVRVKEVRRHALYVGLALDVLCIALAILAATIVRRQVRRHAAILEEHAALTEGRAHELEFFAGRVAHDVASPVATAQLAIDLALRRGATELAIRDTLPRAQRNLRRAQAIIDGLLRFARAGAKPHPGAVADVRRVVVDVLGSVAEHDRTSADLRCEAHPCSVACDEGVLASIVSNLVQNAVKYLGDGPVRRVVVRAAARGDLVRIEVEDTGTGLPPDLLGRVFEPYVRGAGHSTPGLGLGLATVKRLVEGHGGRVGVASEPGRGCRFWVELPAPAPHPNSQALLDPPTARERRV